MASDRGGRKCGFPTTHWSLVDVIRRGGETERRQALERFLIRYLPALQTHLVRTRGVPVDESEDLLQEFVAQRILEKDLVCRADRGAGRFRTFLLTSLDRFLIDRVRRQQAQKRTPAGAALLDIDNRQDRLPVDRAASDAFDVAWARSVIAEAMQRMQQQCEIAGRTEVWGVFQCRLVRPLLDDEPPVPYKQLIEQFGLTSPVQASNILITAKRMYARSLRAVIAEYASDEEDVESELRELREVLARCAR